MGFRSYFVPTKETPKAKEPQAPAPGKWDSTTSSVSPWEGLPIELESQAPSIWDTSLNEDLDTGEQTEISTICPLGDLHNADMTEIMDIKCDVMVSYLYQHQEERLWTMGEDDEGVVLKIARGKYACCPADLREVSGGFLHAVEILNVRCAMTINTKVIKLFLHNNNTSFVPLSNGLRLQVLPDISYLPRCQKHQFAAFIADTGRLVVWDDTPRHILSRAERIEQELLEMIWQGESAYPIEEAKGDSIFDELSTGDVSNAERGLETPRPVMLWQAVHTGIALLLVMAAVGSGWRWVALELAIDGNFIRLAFLISMPAQMWLGLFFFQALVGNVMQFIGPISQMTKNSKSYSGVAPRRLDRDLSGTLPHITIQCPVYKEGLTAVIEPTIMSIKAAISTYEMQGGTSNIFINDDGMQLIEEEQAQARQEFYDEHNIGWVARPRHNPKPAHGEQAFLRRGKFKKASNMNYALWASTRIEEKLSHISRSESWTVQDEHLAYNEALKEVVAEDEGRTWAEGNIRIGDYILLIDSDTRVPSDCFLDAVSEMEQSPQVAILQFSSGVMNVTESFFERGITFFTNLVYTQIKFAVANGDVAPFVGHNAVLRWAAIQEIAYDCPDDHREKFWSEATVSEDFDMALRLQAAGYILRLGAYTGDGFQEGVSLTVYDELARWEKYAYGCSELIFHPLRYWLVRGPFTPLFRQFLCSCIPLPSKVTIMAYIGTYFAIASSCLLTLINYFAIGWYNGYLDHYYLDSFKIYFAIILVFYCLGNVALAVLRYRIEEKSLLPGVVENFKWIVLLTVFLGGISLHVSQAILSHLFSIDMSWGATSKEVESTTFFKEVPKVLARFKWTFCLCIACIAMMIALARFAPVFWQIRAFIAIWPLITVVLGHLLLPLVLNPNLMLFTW